MSIINGEIGSGDRLIFDQIASRLGVSQTPVREAVGRLIQDGLAVEGPGGKLQVVPLTTKYVSEVFLVRSALEGLAAELATPRLSERDLEELCHMLEHGNQGLEQGEVDAYSEGGGLLHKRFIDAADNLVLTRELSTLRTHYQYIIRFSQRHTGNHLVRSQEEHWEILDAFASRDPATARQVVERHVRNSGNRIIELIELDRTAISH